jgi:hypothetical protein
MTSLHRAPAHLTRRHVLALGAVVAVPGAAVIALQARDRTPPGVTTGDEPARDVPVAAPTPQPSKSTGPKLITSGGGPVPFVPGKTMLGAYLDLENTSEAQAVALRRKQLGRDERILHVFYAWTDTLPSSIAWLPAKAYPMISWRGTNHAAILNGTHDALIRRNARRLKRFGRPVLLRWGWEMNGDWYAWSAAKNGKDAAGYVKCWKHLRKIFAEEGAGNVSWVWSPNWNDSPQQDWNAKARYYPGDDQVDWVGVSGYNLHREVPADLFGRMYADYTTRKPLMITEVGAVDRGGSTKADWITLLAGWVEQNPGVGAVVWFDTDTHPGYHEKWRIDTDAESLAAFRAMAGNPHFSA